MLTKMTPDPLLDALARRRNKAISIILRFKEDNLDESLDDETSAAFRTVVLDQINDFHDVCVDLIGASNGVVNEIWLDKIEAIHDAVVHDYNGV
jgi:hypothetical protein